MRRRNEELSDYALSFSSALVLIIVLISEDYLTHSTDDSFWVNLLTAPLMFFGAYLLGGVIFILPALLIQLVIDWWEKELESKTIHVIIAAVVACVIYALLKTYNP